MKKVLIMILTLVLVTSMLAACTEKSNNNENAKNKVAINKEGFPIVDEKLKMSIMGPDVGQANWKDMAFFKEMEKMTNVQFEFTTPPLSDFETKLNLAFASGEIPDVLFGSSLTAEQEVKYGKQGVLIPLEDLIKKYAPNIQKMFEENPDVKKSITTVDGHIYSLPMVDKNAVWYMGPLWYNGKWLDALGVKELPKTTDELYTLLKRFKTEDPNGNGKADEIPFTSVALDDARLWLLGAFGHTAWGIEEINGEVSYTPIEDGYKEYLKFMNKLYDEKLMDREVFSQSNEQKKAKGQSNRVGLFQDWYSYFTTGDKEEEADNDPMFHPISSSVTDEPVAPLSPGIYRGQFSITNKNANPAAAIRWVDYLYSQEGSELLNIGKAGDVWDWVDKDKGTRKLLESPIEGKTIEDYRGTTTPDFGINVPALRSTIEGFPVPEFKKFIDLETDNKIKPFAKIPYPLVYLTPEEQEEVSRINADLDTYVEQMEAKFITGVEPMSSWDKYVKTIEDMGVDKLIQIYQDAYDRWDKSE
ncbi:putative aldouronate transport system substrate-binding protein [Bacillus pakistanensis]|uniref:Aldouronate transport system substrate-binding protein n=1 Tax=Rossellomorea pakistanensis TaxID=992288 RepID=A0ABS2N9G8_9BACI|nr:extracellular solute-binding protein [Bacillus pakistanensis]MBM7584512.1 putative aldouronate transport system substrate-binding protein [Bacillus pakistanensis]